MSSLTFQLAVPATELSPNARIHWGRKAVAVKTAREAAVLTSQMCNDCGNGVDVVELPEWLPIR